MGYDLTSNDYPRPRAFSALRLLAVLIWLAVAGLLAYAGMRYFHVGIVPQRPAVSSRVAQPAPQAQAPTASTPDTSAATDTPPASAATGDAPLPIICIDPGHPSEVNPGAEEQNGAREVEVNYDVALALQSKLTDEKIALVVMTRDFRSYDPKHPKVVTNRARAEIANRAHAVLLLRLHCDTGKGAGFTLYYPDKAATKNGKTGPPANVRAASKIAANALHDGMNDVLDGVLADDGVKGESATFIGEKQGALTGSIYSEVPAVTVEMVFLSNPKDAAFISSPDGCQQMAEALSMGIVRYLDTVKAQGR